MMDIDSLVTAAMNVDANLHLAGRQDYHDNGRQSKGKGRLEAGPSSSQAEGPAQANMLGKGKRKQPSQDDKCFKCGGTGHRSKECPRARFNNDKDTSWLKQNSKNFRSKTSRSVSLSAIC